MPCQTPRFSLQTMQLDRIKSAYEIVHWDEAMYGTSFTDRGQGWICGGSYIVLGMKNSSE